MNRYYNSHSYIQNFSKNTPPLMRYSGEEDFNIWKKRSRDKLTELLKMPHVKCEDLFAFTSEEDCGEFLKKDFEFQSEEQYFVQGALIIPKGLKKATAGVICLQGHSSGMHISLGIKKFERDNNTLKKPNDFALQAVKEGFCAVIMEQRYMGKAGVDENGAPACVYENAAMSSLLLGRTAIGERVWDTQRMIDVTEKYFSQYIEKEKIILLGTSGGGTATFYTACLDDRIYIAIPSCAVCSFDDSIMKVFHCPCNFIPDLRKYFDMGDIGGVIAPRKLIIPAGEKDPIFPIEGTRKSYNEIKAFYTKLEKEENCLLVTDDVEHAFPSDKVWKEVRRMLEAEQENI